MNLLAPKPASKSPALISNDTILLLAGSLFGMCVSGNLPPEVKTWFAFAGTTGLLSYLGLRVVALAKLQAQQRIAVMQIEERLDRHSHFDPPVDAPRVNQPIASSSRA